MFYEKFKPETLLIKEFANWIITLREKQQTIGSAVIILKNQKETMAHVSQEEFAELTEVFGWYENKCKAVFGAEKINYLALMMKDNFVHFHAIPRYAEPKMFCDVEFVDGSYPKPPVLNAETTDIVLLNKILNELKK